MADSITLRILTAVYDALSAAAPDATTVRKGRKSPSSEAKCPMVQVYWHIEQNVGVGNPRRPMLMTRNLVMEIKITVVGEDEDFDAQRQWVVAALWNAGNLGGLVKNLSEAETIPVIDDSSVSGSMTAGAIRYAVEFTTSPGDITAVN
jgi:hypothetical protein